MSITNDTFKRILEVRKILPQFSRLVQGYGIKFSEDTKVRTGCLTPLFLSEDNQNYTGYGR